MDVQLEGLHVGSQIDQEYFTLTVDLLHLRADSSKLELDVHHVQIDDLTAPSFPVVLCPADAGCLAYGAQTTGGEYKTTEDPRIPWVGN